MLRRLAVSLLCACMVAAIASAAPAPPKLPDQYMVTRTKLECGNMKRERDGGKATAMAGTRGDKDCGGYTAHFLFDGKMRRSLEVVDSGDSNPTYTLRAGDLGVQYLWSGANGVGCEATPITASYPFTGEWDWIKDSGNVTYDGEAPCPSPPQKALDSAGRAKPKPSTCRSWSGPWPIELTSEAQLYFGVGETLPTQHRMQCAIFPFELFFTYADWTVGPPPAKYLKVPASCPTTTAVAA